MKLACQILIILFQLINLLTAIKSMIEGRPARAPLGFHGVLAVIGANVFAFILFFGAGAFSEIFHKP